MLFSSTTFLFCFFPIVVIGYYTIHPVLRNLFLLIASLFFYAWGEPRYILVMIGVILVNYTAGVAMASLQQYKKMTLVFAILLNLLVLGGFKYTNFAIEVINDIACLSLKTHNIVLPIGISFYIFQSMSYVIDLYRGTIKVQYNPLKFALYVSLFPQLVAGPIVKYRDVAASIDERFASLQDITDGIRRFIVGLSKKVLLANSMGLIVDKIYLTGPSELNLPIAWLGAIAYSLQIFFDFSGYSDMAIGLGKVFGFHFLENFNYPYIASSVTDFWRRWHISLSSWFKEYLYIPLGGNRVSSIRNNINLFIVFFSTGLWHGASWNFIVWGLWHGLFLIMEKRLKLLSISNTLLNNIFKHIYVIFVFVVGWVFFRADNLTIAANYIAVMFGVKANSIVSFGFSYYADRKDLIMLLISLLCCYPWKFKRFNEFKYAFFIKDIILLFLLVLSISSIAASGYNPFIYFRF